MGLVIGGIFIILGVFVLCVATFGIFRFEYALNRIHVAAKCDTLGSMLNPAASHMVARAEAGSNPDLGKECGVSEYEGG